MTFGSAPQLEASSRLQIRSGRGERAVKAFFDTNILLYSTTDNARKQRAADEVVSVTLNTHTAAVSLAHDHGLSFYDALIVASAIETGCDILYIEDMQHGRAIGGLAIVNPFVESAP
jgi:predicted nucleic acid-binding protein